MQAVYIQTTQFSVGEAQANVRVFLCVQSSSGISGSHLCFLPGLFLHLDKLVVNPHHLRGLEEGVQQFFSRGPVGIAGEASVLVCACNIFDYHTTFNNRILMERAEGRGGAEVALCKAWMGQQMGFLHSGRGSVPLVNYISAEASHIARAFDFESYRTWDNDWFHRLCDFGVHKWDV